jgi:hypothetical protein
MKEGGGKEGTMQFNDEAIGKNASSSSSLLPIIIMIIRQNWAPGPFIHTFTQFNGKRSSAPSGKNEEKGGTQKQVKVDNVGRGIGKNRLLVLLGLLLCGEWNGVYSREFSIALPNWRRWPPPHQSIWFWWSFVRVSFVSLPFPSHAL